MSWKIGDWAWSPEHNEPCRLVEVRRLWGKDTVLVWLPGRDATVRLSVDVLVSFSDKSPESLERISYVTAAARIVDALERDTLIAPLEGTVIPLPHQIYALSQAMSSDRIRYLLADEVGLGKTIEAGLVLRELKIRGLIKRILVVAPTGLVSQWVSEMRNHFNEDFRMVIPGDFSTWRKIAAVDESENLWRLHDQVVCPLDSVKPIDSRRGWSADRVAKYNRERFEDLVSAGWDLIIIDEAHRLGGSTAHVARYRLGEALSQAAPYLLLLSATPHQGKTDAFRRLLSFLDSEAFPDEDAINQESVAPYVIRTEKRNAIDTEGLPLFKPRHTQLISVPWKETHQDQKVLYEAVTNYVREGYNQATLEKNSAIGFLMVLFQRLVTSSVCAIRTALERRLEVLDLPIGQLSLFEEEVGEQWAYLDSQQQMESVIASRMKGLSNERSEVELLLSAARRCEAKGPDIKAQALLDWIHKLQREENNPKLKVLVFTEFIPTQSMLADFLENRGFPVVCLNGSLNLDKRQEVQRAFSNDAQILISTDAGGEGLNLQFCHVIFNYDLPWNPMKLEQRIGRVDRIGQTHVVRAQNFTLEDTVEQRVREVLEEKLEQILVDFGVDKLADVLDSEEGGVDFDSLYMSAVLSPEEAEKRTKQFAESVRERAAAAKDGSRLLGATSTLDPMTAQKILHHQMPYWTECMTASYLRTQQKNGALVLNNDEGYRLLWPDGTELRKVVFSREEAFKSNASYLSMEHPKVRGLTSRFSQFVPGQPIAIVELDGISDKVSGIWSLWRIGLGSKLNCAHRIMPMFLSDDGRVLAPTARAVWDRLICSENKSAVLVSAGLVGEEAIKAYDISLKEAESHGQAIFSELMHDHRNKQVIQRKKGRKAFEVRRKAIERIGLHQVRNFRIRAIEQEEKEWQAKISQQDVLFPELTSLIIIRIAKVGEAL